jgi:hypothetical protein
MISINPSPSLFLSQICIIVKKSTSTAHRVRLGSTSAHFSNSETSGAPVIVFWLNFLSFFTHLEDAAHSAISLNRRAMITRKSDECFFRLEFLLSSLHQRLVDILWRVRRRRNWFCGLMSVSIDGFYESRKRRNFSRLLCLKHLSTFIIYPRMCLLRSMKISSQPRSRKPLSFWSIYIYIFIPWPSEIYPSPSLSDPQQHMQAHLHYPLISMAIEGYDPSTHTHQIYFQI